MKVLVLPDQKQMSLARTRPNINSAYAGQPISQTREVSGFDKIEVNGADDCT